MSMGSDTSWVGKKALRRIGGMSDALSSLHRFRSRVLRELTNAEKKIADLQVELQGRKDDKNVAHLTHVIEMKKKIEPLARMTTILRDVY